MVLETPRLGAQVTWLVVSRFSDSGLHSLAPTLPLRLQLSGASSRLKAGGPLLAVNSGNGVLPSARNAKPSVGTILTTEVSIVDTCSLVPGLPAPRGWQLSSASTLHTHSPSRCRVAEGGPIRCWLLIRDSTARVYKRQGAGGPNHRPVSRDSESDLRMVGESLGLIYSPLASRQKNKLRVQTRGSL